MSIAKGIQKYLDPHGIFNYIRDAQIVYTGRIWNPKAKNLITKQKMFLKKGIKVKYDYELNVDYDGPYDYETVEGVGFVYMTSKEFTILSLTS